ncbi:MAG: C10 family peptidase [Lepagella sp.]
MTISLLLTLSMPAFSARRSETECREIAGRQASLMSADASSADIRLAASSKSLGLARKCVDEAFYVYNIGSRGFAIISADPETTPLIAYSDSSSFPADTAMMPANLRWWLKAQEEAAAIRRNAAGSHADNYLAPLRAPSYTAPQAVEPILGDIAWDQSAPYNDLCPEKCVTGCTATAMAMVMKHYNYPRIGKGNHAYVSAMMGYNVSYDFEAKPFDWNNMLDQYADGGYNDSQATAVAELMKACGVAIDTDYRPTSSSANSLKVSDALIKYFRYNDNTLFRLRTAYTNDEWKEMLNQEMAAGRPVIYNGSSKQIGHEFVVDGSDESGLYHINWGWSGVANGYYDISLLNPDQYGTGGGTAEGGGYIFNQGMVIRIKPEKDDTADYTHNWYMNSMVLINELDANNSIADTEEIRLGAYTFANYGSTFNGQLAIVFSKSLDGEPAAVIGIQNHSQVAPSYGGNLEFKGILPEDFEDGYYYVYLASKPYKGDSWDRVRAIYGYDSYFTLSHRNGRITFADRKKTPKLSGNVNPQGDLVINSFGTFRVTAKNTSDTFYFGYVGVMITPSAESERYAMYYEPMYLDPGEEKTIDLTRALINNANFYLQEGQSLICGIYSFGDRLYALTDFKPVDLGMTTAPKLQLTETLECQEVFKSGEEFFIPFSVDCLGDYKFNLVAGIFPWGSYQTTITLQTPLDMKEGDHVDSEIRGYLNPPLKEGKYLVALLAYDITTGQYDYELGFTYFEVSGIAESGVDQIQTAEEDTPIYYNQLGRRVDHPQKGDILIRVSKAGAQKIVY